MALTSKQVVDSFVAGKPARSANIWTDGTSLYSYEMRIAQLKNGCVFVYGDKCPSRTTSKHVGMALGAAAKVKVLTFKLNGAEAEDFAWDGKPAPVIPKVPRR